MARRLRRPLFLTAGIRRDDNDNFQDFTTWRTAASLVLREFNMRPHASVGTAVKLPTMFEQFGTDQFFVPNPNLTPEKSFGWDAGMEFTFDKGRVLFDVTYFHANLTDKINGFFFDPKIGNFTAINLPGESTRDGVEISARYKVASNLTTWWRLHVSRCPRSERGRASCGGRRTRRAPTSPTPSMAGEARRRLPLYTTGTWRTRPFTLPFFFPSQRVGLDPYWLINATASYKLQPGVEVFGRVENSARSALSRGIRLRVRRRSPPMRASS